MLTSSNMALPKNTITDGGLGPSRPVPLERLASHTPTTHTSSTATKTKTVTKNVYIKRWPEAIRNTFTPTHDEDDLHVIKLKCNVCYKHVEM